MISTVAIVGRGKTAQHAPYEDSSVDIWAFNDNAMNIPRVSAMFEMHPDWDNAARLEGVPGIDQYRQWLTQPHDFPIYMHNGGDYRVPSSRGYPFEAVEFPFKRTMMKGEIEVKDFYTSSTPYAIALAIAKRYRRIELYGIELTQETEYRDHRDSVFYWLGRASGVGIQHYIHADSKLYDRSLYWRASKR